MRKYFEHAYQGFCNSFCPIVESMAEMAKVTFVYLTLPIWIIPYAIYKKMKERSAEMCSK